MRFWQAILWADNGLSTGFIDGDFGPNTANETRVWESRFGVTSADDRVDSHTWSAAEDFIIDETPSTNFLYASYLGSNGRIVSIRRQNSTGDWSFKMPGTTNTWYNTSH